MAEEFPRGRFVWYELNTTDKEGAVGFYQELIGWGTEDFAMDGQPYLMLTNDKGPFGGLDVLSPEALQGGAAPHWLAYIATPDVDATATQAKELGGSVVVEPMDLPGAGRMAVLKDPQGAMIALYSSAKEEQGGHDGPPEMKEFSWHELATTDYEAAFEFYQKLFGWKMTEVMDMGEAGKYLMYGRTEMPLGGMYNRPEPMATGWWLYAKVPDLDASVELVKKRGGQIVNGPMEVPGGDRVVMCVDPQGAAFALHSSSKAA